MSYYDIDAILTDAQVRGPFPSQSSPKQPTNTI
jgi:hypothetical protein